MPHDTPPCDKVCPLRTWDCHGWCPDYAKYAKRQEKKRLKHLKENEAAYNTMRVRRDKIVPIAQRKNKERV